MITVISGWSNRLNFRRLIPFGLNGYTIIERTLSLDLEDNEHWEVHPLCQPVDFERKMQSFHLI